MMMSLDRALLAGCLLAFGLTHAAEPESRGAGAAGLSEARLSYGEYLTTAGGCLACHTRSGGKPFEGGRRIDTPFGILYTPNITASRAQGSGGFSDEDFLRALQKGIDPGGRPYYPAFPYRSLTRVADDELLAIKDYLFSLEPSSYRPPQSDLDWPFSIRDLIFGWQELYFRRGPVEPDATKSDEWQRGAYLAEGLGQCGECHGSSRVGGGADGAEQGVSITETVVDGWYGADPALDLTAAVSELTVDEVVARLQAEVGQPQDQAQDAATTAIPPLVAALHGRLSRLALSDLRALAIYLKDPAPAEVYSGEPLVPDALADERYRNGRDLYIKHCSACHQGQGQGLAPYFPALQGNPTVSAEEPDSVVETILIGAPEDPAKAYSAHVLMPSFRSVLSDTQLADVISFIRASWGNGAAPVSAETVRELRAGN